MTSHALGVSEAVGGCCCIYSSKQWEDVIEDTLKEWRHIRNQTPPVDGHRKVKRLKLIHIPPLTRKPCAGAVYNEKWRTDRQWQRWRSASSSRPNERTLNPAVCSQADPPMPQPAALWSSPRNVLRQRLTIFSSEYWDLHSCWVPTSKYFIYAYLCIPGRHIGGVNEVLICSLCCFVVFVTTNNLLLFYYYL